MASVPSPGSPCLNFNIKVYCAVGLMSTHADRRWPQRIIITMFSLFILTMTINLISVLIQSVRGEKILRGADIFQLLFDLLISIFVFVDFHLFVQRVYPLLHQIRPMFDRTQPDIGAICRRTERKIFIIFGALVFSVAAISYVQKVIFGLTPEEITLSSNYEKKAHPDKQPPFLLWIPLDDTVQPTYSVVLAYSMICLLEGAVMVFHMITYFPIISVHMQGHCQYLASRIKTLGNPANSASPPGKPVSIADPLRNAAGIVNRLGNTATTANSPGNSASIGNPLRNAADIANRLENTANLPGNSACIAAPLRILVNNAASIGKSAGIADQLGNPAGIATPLKILAFNVHHINEGQIDNSNCPVEQTVSSVSRDDPLVETIELKPRQTQDKDQVKSNRKKKAHLDITKYYDTELLKLEALFRDHQEYLRLRKKLQEALEVSVILKNFTNILLPICLCQLMLVRDLDRFIQMLMQYLLALAMSFSLVWSSEYLDRGNDLIYKSLYDNQWYRLHPSVAKHLVLMLGVSKQTNRLTYFGGALDICFPSFVSVLKISYSLYVLLKNVLRPPSD